MDRTGTTPGTTPATAGGTVPAPAADAAGTAAPGEDRAPGFIAYEYLRVTTDLTYEALHRDAYAAFGWVLDDRRPRTPGRPEVVLTLKRDRRLRHRTAVSELQRRCARALAEIVRLERAPHRDGTMAALVVGLLGTVPLAGSVFAVQAGLPVLCAVLGVPGLLLWAAAWPVHGAVRARVAARCAGPVDEQYEIVASTGEQAVHLLG